MSKTILVTYSTWSGTTEEIADDIAQTLNKQGYITEVIPMGALTDLAKFDAVIAGTSIRSTKTHPDLYHFLWAHQLTLARLPLALFAVCGTMRDDTPENRKITEGYLQDTLKEVPSIKPVSIGLFGGVIDYSKLTGLAGFVARLSKLPEGDFRDWSQIQRWAMETAPKMVDTIPA